MFYIYIYYRNVRIIFSFFINLKNFLILLINKIKIFKYKKYYFVINTIVTFDAFKNKFLNTYHAERY